jgi:hypothetical protein
MEFLDINLTKVFYSMLLTVPSILVDFKKTILFSGFKNPYKKIHETRKLESIHEQHFIERNNRVEVSRFYAQKPRLKMQFKNSISGFKLGLLRKEPGKQRVWTPNRR